MARRQSTSIKVRKGDRHLVLDAALDARFEAERGVVAALRVALPTEAVRDLYQLPAGIWVGAMEDKFGAGVRVPSTPSDYTGIAIATSNAWVARWNLGANSIRGWAFHQVQYWLESRNEWHDQWLCDPSVFADDPTRCFMGAEPPWRYLPFLEAPYHSRTIDQMVEHASLKNAFHAELDDLPVNGIAEDYCAWPIAGAPISASPLDESLNNFLERAQRHYLEREKGLTCRSSEPLQRSAIGPREMETHCRWLLMSRACNRSHQQIADASEYMVTRQAVSSAIARLEKLLGFPPFRRPPGRPREK